MAFLLLPVYTILIGVGLWFEFFNQRFFFFICRCSISVFDIGISEAFRSLKNSICIEFEQFSVFK